MREATRKWLRGQFRMLDGHDGWGHGWRATQKRRHCQIIHAIERRLSRPPRSCLDIGCSTGELIAEIKARYPETSCAGMDFVQRAVDWAAQRFPACDWFQAELPNIPREVANYDLVVSASVLNYLEAPERFKAIEEIDRISGSGGWFCFETPLDDGTRYFTVDEVEELVSSRFDIVDTNICYGRLSRSFERPMLRLVSLSHDLNEVASETPQTDWTLQRRLAHRLATLPGSAVFVSVPIAVLGTVARWIVSMQTPVLALDAIGRWVAPKWSRSHVIVMARKR